MASSGRSHATPQRPSDRLPSPSSTHSPWPGSCEAGKPVRVGADHRIDDHQFYRFCAFSCCLASFLFLWCCTRAPPAAPAAAPFLPPITAPPTPPTTAPFSLLCFFFGGCWSALACPCVRACSSARTGAVTVVSSSAAANTADGMPILVVMV